MFVKMLNTEQSDHSMLDDVDVNPNNIKVTQDVIDSWQSTLDLLAEIVEIPAALIMKISPENIRVFVSSHSPHNPYMPNDTESLGHGLYCETVLSSRQELNIPNALKDKDWNQNPDIKLGMIAYCGLPLVWPNGTAFGTICMLDNKERHFERPYRHLLKRFQESVNTNLKDLYKHEQLRELNRQLDDKIQRRTIELASLNKQLIAEIESRNRAEKSIEVYKNFDVLTSLPNRLYFNNRLAQLLEKKSEASVFVFYLALRSFKSVNDTYGYSVGDTILQLFGQRLSHALGESGVLARMSAVEFAIARSFDQHENVAMPTINQILSACSTPFHVGDLTINICCSIGVAQSPLDAVDAISLIQKASAALGISKTEGTNYNFFSEQTQTSIDRRFLLESHLVDAIKNKEFSLHYQPLINLKSREVIGAEALIRWHNPILGSVPPDQFIDLAERNGQINDIGNFVLHTALAQAAKWQKGVAKPFRIAINVSPIQFKDPYFPDHIVSLLRLYDIPAELLEIEVTEGVLMSDEGLAKHTIERLLASGVQISLDDFGTGFASLSYLQKYNFSSLKIDRCFIANLDKNQKDQELTRAIIAMGKKMNLRVVAEGVESELHDVFIRHEECDLGQGYLYGRPVSAKEFEAHYLLGQSVWSA